MTIVHVIWNLGIGGAEEMLVDIVNEQARHHRVLLVVVNDLVSVSVCSRVAPGAEVHLLGRKPGSLDVRAFLKLNLLLLQRRPDVVHSHNWNLLKVMPLKLGKAVLTVHTIRDQDPFDHTVARYDRVIAISRAVAHDIAAQTGKVRPALVMNGVNCHEIRFEKRHHEGAFRIVQVGTLDHDVKGQDVLLRAVARVRSDASGSDVSVDFIGRGPSRPYLEQLAWKLGLDGAVRFRGEMSRRDLYEELCEYELLVQPSRREGFGLTIAEAMVANVPVLVSDLAGPNEVIENGRFGRSFRAEDDADCAEKILEIRREYGTASMRNATSAARKHAITKFDVGRTASEYLQQYAELLETEESSPNDFKSHVAMRSQLMRAPQIKRGLASVCRNFACSVLAVLLMACGRVRRAKRAALSDGVVTAIYFHNPNARLFRRCIDWLSHNGYTFISASELLQILYDGKKPPRGAVWLSFDDGFRQILENVLPTIRQRNIPLTVFLPTGVIAGGGHFPWLASCSDVRDALNTEEVQRIAAEPEITLGSHTVQHVVTTDLGEERAREEFLRSKLMLQAWGPRTVECFAYPEGRYSGSEPRLLAELGYRLAATTDNGFILPGANALLLPRFSVADNISFPEAICNMVGVWRPSIEKVRSVTARFRRFGRATQRSYGSGACPGGEVRT